GAVREVFARFLAQVRELAVVCAEDDELLRLPVAGRRVTYGIETGDYRWRELGLTIGVPGRHNQLNACGAAALALELGVEEATVAEALAAFKGARRRLELVGEWRGARLYDDYGHHPTEVRATLGAARELAGQGRLLLVFQPHRYTRLAWRRASRWRATPPSTSAALPTSCSRPPSPRQSTMTRWGAASRSASSVRAPTCWSATPASRAS